MRQLARVGLAEQAHELAGNLPLGRQRVLEIARALAADPLLIVLDEPAAGLRRLEKQALAELLRALRAEGMTILLVEHDMEFVMGLVDRIVVMDFGVKLAEGLPAADPRRSARAGSLSRRRRVTALLTADDVHVAYGRVEAVRGVSLALAGRADRHRDRPERRRQDDAARRAHGPAAVARTHHLRRRRSRRLDVEERVERGLCLVPEKPRAVRRDVGRRQPRCSAPTRTGATAPRRGARLDEVFARFPRLRRAARAARRHAVGRRAADAGARPRADVAAAPADARRAEPRASRR